MIFVTVGTQVPFDRLVRGVDIWCGMGKTEAFAQIGDPGPQGYVPQNMLWRCFLDPKEYEECFEAAHLVIAHAGMGSILSALVAGKPIVIMPRQASLKEHRNDHQVATANRFRGRLGVHVAMDEASLPGIVESALWNSAGQPEPLGRYADPSLITAVRQFILYGNLEDKQP
jgi:UDP-N-acetylglucosamine transferase subunit ALG13